MKKVLLIISILICISLVSAEGVNVRSLYSVASPSDLDEITENLEYIYGNYEVEVTFYISNKDRSATGESLMIFENSQLSQGLMKDWNILVFYNTNKNELKFVTSKNCGFSYNNLKNIKDSNYIQNVLNFENPTNDQISDMFLRISVSLKSLVQLKSPNPDICPVKTFSKMQLQPDEYIVPSGVLKAFYSVVMETPWEEIGKIKGAPRGVFLRKNFIPFKLFDSPKGKFYNLLKDKLGIQTSQVKEYYQIFSTPGNLVMSEGYDDPVLFHERTHKIMSQILTEQEQQTLISARSDFLTFLHEELYSSFGPFSQLLVFAIKTGSWQELYAYMLELQKYPREQNSLQYIDDDVYDLFALRYSQADDIYQRIYDLASE